jgi:hypothetical protein
MAQRQSYADLERQHGALDTQLDQLEAAETLLAGRLHRLLADFIAEWNYRIDRATETRVEDCIRDAILEITSGPRNALERERDEIAQELESRDADDLRREYYRSVL